VRKGESGNSNCAFKNAEPFCIRSEETWKIGALTGTLVLKQHTLVDCIDTRNSYKE